MNKTKVNTEIGDVALPVEEIAALGSKCTGRIEAKGDEAVGIQSAFIVDLSQVGKGMLRHWPQDRLVFDGTTLQGPLYMASSTLGLGDADKVWVDIIDSTGVRLVTHSVEALLQLADHFVERHRKSLLAAAAMHYGFDDAYALMGRR